jgi:small GTP-binding protein
VLDTPGIVIDVVFKPDFRLECLIFVVTTKYLTKSSQHLTHQPGHQAFHSMRQHGATVTDVIILVVAATEGVRPQTKECIRIAEQSNVPIVVAINKCDLHDANPARTREELLQV